MRHPVRLEPVTHTYFIADEVEVPGFSAICAAMGVSKPNMHYTAAGRDRGTAVHAWSAHIATVGVPSRAADPRIAPRVDQFKDFLSKSGFRAEGAEISLYDPWLRFACTPDLFGYIRGVPVVIDIKTGAKLKIAELQTAAQSIALAANGFRVRKRFGLYLKDKNFRLVEHKSQDAKYWEAIVSGYHAMTPEQREVFASDQFDKSDPSCIGMVAGPGWRRVVSAFAARSFYI